MAASTGTWTTELLRLHPPGVGDQQGTVVCNQRFFEVDGLCCVFVLGVVCNEGFGNGLSDGVNLRYVSSTLDADADVHVGEDGLADNEDGLIDLVSEDFRLDEVDGGSVDADETTALTGVCYCSSGLNVNFVGEF